MTHYTPTKLETAIFIVNNRYSKGLNDDDQLVKMIAIDKITKGYSFKPLYDSYELCTDYDKLLFYATNKGYWSKEVEYFNEVLKNKGGYIYMTELNEKVRNELKN
jgi:hypothetical protein